MGLTKIEQQARRQKIDNELKALYDKHHGLMPRTVVDWAQDHKKSALHGCFEWDNAKAGDAYRLWQARELIVEVRAIYPADNKPRQVYVSVVEDRGSVGYLALAEVISEERKRVLFLQQALNELQRLQLKYNDLLELSGVWLELTKAKTKFEEKTRTKKAR